MMAERLDCAGLINIPQHYHNAYIYQADALLLVAEPGFLDALKRDLGEVPLVEASIAIDEQRLRRVERGEVVCWKGRRR